MSRKLTKLQLQMLIAIYKTYQFEWFNPDYFSFSTRYERMQVIDALVKKRQLEKKVEGPPTHRVSVRISPDNPPF